MITEKVGYSKFQGATRHQYERAVEYFDLAFANINPELKLTNKEKNIIIDVFYACKERCKNYIGIGGSFWLATAIEDISETKELVEDLLKHYSEK